MAAMGDNLLGPKPFTCKMPIVTNKTFFRSTIFIHFNAISTLSQYTIYIKISIDYDQNSSKLKLFYHKIYKNILCH